MIVTGQVVSVLNLTVPQFTLQNEIIGETTFWDPITLFSGITTQTVVLEFKLEPERNALVSGVQFGLMAGLTVVVVVWFLKKFKWSVNTLRRGNR